MNALTVRLFAAIKALRTAHGATEARHCKIEIADALLALIGFEDAPTLLPQTPKAFKKEPEPTLTDVQYFCARNGIRASDAEWFYNKMVGCGWKNNGRPVVSWTGTIIAWKVAGHLPSQKVVVNGRSQPVPQNEISRDLNRLANQIKREERTT